MAEILEMQRQRRHLAAKRGFQNWSNRFSERFDEETRIVDLSDSTLWALIKGGEESYMPVYELIMGVRNMGVGPRFYYLESQDKMAVMDVALFLLDQLRFEAMRRLGWLETYPAYNIPLLDLVEGFENRYSAIKNEAPLLSDHHPRYAEYESTFTGDRGSFVRRLIPEALQAFEDRGTPSS